MHVPFCKSHRATGQRANTPLALRGPTEHPLHNAFIMSRRVRARRASSGLSRLAWGCDSGSSSGVSCTRPYKLRKIRRNPRESLTANWCVGCERSFLGDLFMFQDKIYCSSRCRNLAFCRVDSATPAVEHKKGLEGGRGTLTRSLAGGKFDCKMAQCAKTTHTHGIHSDAIPLHTALRHGAPVPASRPGCTSALMQVARDTPSHSASSEGTTPEGTPSSSVDAEHGFLGGPTASHGPSAVPILWDIMA